MEKKIIPWIVYDRDNAEEFLKQGAEFEAYGADELYIKCDSKDYTEKEEFLKASGELAKQVDIPIIINYKLERFEDVKKALYTGAKAMAVNAWDFMEDSLSVGAGEIEELTTVKALKEASARFGKDRIYLVINEKTENSLIESVKEFVSAIIVDNNWKDFVPKSELPVYIQITEPIQQENEAKDRSQELFKLTKQALLEENTLGILTDFSQREELNAFKRNLKAEGILVNTYESSIPFSEMKKNNDGLLPVVVQDYKTKEVLMVAYMNEEAYNMTVETGKMTYYSRSRSKLWIKGETSGHFQYVKSLTVDCDKDTLLAKVRQIGPACHTGSPTCFFEETYKKPYDDINPLTVLDEVFQVIIDRKEHPKEGSYTNYLFDKGIDKILKKCGEEAAEIIIAAKNPDSSELKYEISDFLYHMMVLMAECGLDWKDIIKELAHRR
ncbi:bifunctional phosphoribosyl-AMP cyclohydrolase/phosphoribosyl-ATP diphosphatase HisIE [Anaerocolumna chitinilytica]|uniref:Histidine biosynthesis bifunctional protein HisIE n=1 Tax=Anaerocolumna chitinilytica TaxID=1727145 RepID=A0A7I8DR09_9FIRM|nr:bifunctional phosphoribosyl-AMP cyclohydrolase/phosphoribosyl-ATP diphosphatase HisIE [Anaerocolumna chitinilytica]BCK00108.1 hypothetical protein bsdcttw_31480 [Anaerocolumna chitinilytica]